MNSTLDIVASIVVGGIILLMLLGFNGTVINGAAQQTLKGTVQTNLTSVTDLLECDLRKLGYNISALSDTCIAYADTSKVSFYSDLDNSGSVKTVQYWLSTTNDPSKVNPRARILYRKVNNSQQTITLGITQLRFFYYDSSGQPLTSNPVSRPSKIRSIRMIVTAESGAPYNSSYSGVTWERIFKPKNLK
jgi:hypothetical protein